MIRRLLLYIRTLRFLKPRQLIYLLIRRLFPERGTYAAIDVVRQRLMVGRISDWASTSPSIFQHAQAFRFLNITRLMPERMIDWVSGDMPKLWRYNLHYFDYLFDTGPSLDEKAFLISDWITNNPRNRSDAWEPYTVSLRIVNWVKFFMESTVILRDGWLQSLYAQAMWLENNIEYHLLGNHYLKNGVALFFAGLYLEGTDADRWFTMGRQILIEQLNEQFLLDGGHFERSPMYHSIGVMDYLDVLNLMKGSSEARRFVEEQQFVARVHEALTFLDDLCFPDGEIPLFNDAAFGIAPTPADIFAYGGKVIAYTRRSVSNAIMIAHKPQTGCYVIREQSDMIVIDGGPVGPDYQPGHAHADTLSFELAVNGHRVIVDSGVYDYEASSRRAYARSTKAHNTLCIDHQDQSETWDIFRVARRAYPLYGRLTCDEYQCATFEGAHDGYARLPGRPIHSRVIHYVSPGEWTVHDCVNGRGVHTVESRLHIHPDYIMTLVGPSVEIVDRKGNLVLRINPAPAVDSTIEQGWYFPEFGRELSAPTLLMTYRGEIPITLIYKMTKPISSNA